MKDLRNKLVLLLAFLNISILIYLIIIVNTLPKIKTQDFYPTNDVTILDSNNNLINHLPTFKSDITYEEIPQNVINALISTEDEAFFIHNGINPKRIIKAILTDIKSHYAKEGASTITQQVIKNTYLSSEKNINRKVKEIILAIKLENSMKKSDIITYYLNNVLFSDNIYGIYNASLYFFNKKPALLTVDEAAMLVGLIQLPNKYNPYKNLAEATIRRDIVLKAMYKNNFLTHDELEIYRNIKLENKLKKNVIFQNTSYYNPYLDLIDTKKIVYFIKVNPMIQNYNYLNSLVFVCFFNNILQLSKMNKNYCLKKGFLMILDEFGSSFNIPNFDGIISNLRKFFSGQGTGGGIYMAIQGITQLEKIYGKEASDIIITNSPIKTFLGGSAVDKHTKEVVADWAGETKVWSDSKTYASKHTTIGMNEGYHSLLSNYINKLPRYKALVFVNNEVYEDDLLFYKDNKNYKKYLREKDK